MTGLPRLPRPRTRPHTRARQQTTTGGADPETDVDRAAPDLDFDVDLRTALRVLRGGH